MGCTNKQKTLSMVLLINLIKLNNNMFYIDFYIYKLNGTIVAKIKSIASIVSQNT